MASYLRPRRGRKSTAETQAIVLKKGEVFFEIGNDGTPTTGSDAVAFGKIKMGNGLSTYQNLGYFIDVDTSVVDWDNTGYSTATSADQGGDLYGNLNAIAPTATMKSILGNVKALLYKLSTQVTTLNNDMTTTVGVDSVPFKFRYNSSDDSYGYLDKDQVFIPFGGIVNTPFDLSIDTSGSSPVYGYIDNENEDFHPFDENPSPLNTIFYVLVTIQASSWNSDNEYSFESTYPHSRYNVFVTPVYTMTKEEFAVASNALMTGHKRSLQLVSR